MFPWISAWEGQYDFPAGLAYIAASLKADGHSVAWFNVNDHFKLGADAIRPRLTEAIRKHEADVLCVGGLSAHYTAIKFVLDVARDTEIITVLGGGLLSSSPKLVFEALEPTYGVIGEGEETISELAREIVAGREFARLKQVKGIVFRDPTGQVTITGERPAIMDLDTIPFPDFAGFDLNRYMERQLVSTLDMFTSVVDDPRMATLIASRSCPYSCTFCFHPLGKKYRQRSLDNIFREIDHLVAAYQPNILNISDELFAVSSERVREFCRRIKPYGLNWYTSLRVDSVDKETLTSLRDSGCYLVGYGLESYSAPVLRSMKKKITPEQIDNALKLTQEAHIAIQGNFIFGDRNETLETARETLRWWEDHPQYRVWLSWIRVYPGTELYAYAVAKSIIDDELGFLENGCPLINVSSMNDSELAELKNEVWRLHHATLLPARVLTVWPEGVQPEIGVYHFLRIECPVCKHVGEYHKVRLILNNDEASRQSIGCRNCNTRLDLVIPGKCRLIEAVDFRDLLPATALKTLIADQLASTETKGQLGVNLLSCRAVDQGHLLCPFLVFNTSPKRARLRRVLISVPVTDGEEKHWIELQSTVSTGEARLERRVVPCRNAKGQHWIEANLLGEQEWELVE